MPATVRATLDTIPPDEVSAWVEGNQVGVYLAAVLATLVTYDAREFLRLVLPPKLSPKTSVYT